jgi:hypothetical protein
MTCLIQKSMSTLMQATMCYLHNETAFINAGRVLNQESYSKRFCEWKNERNLGVALKQLQDDMEEFRRWDFVL